MKIISSLLCTLLVLLFCTSVIAEDKVVVIPMLCGKTGGSGTKISNVVTVAKSGGDFTDPVAAADSITDASKENPYLIIVGPGSYAITTTIKLNDYISIMGAGINVTVIENAIPSAEEYVMMIDGSMGSNISDISILSRDSATYTRFWGIAVEYPGNDPSYDRKNPSIKNVSVNISQVSGVVHGIESYSDEMIMENLRIEVYGTDGSYNEGLTFHGKNSQLNGASVFISGGEILYGISDNSKYGGKSILTGFDSSVSGGKKCHALSIRISSSIISNSDLSASCNEETYGLRSYLNINEIRSSTIEVEGLGNNFGIYNTYGAPYFSDINVDVSNSGPDATSYALYNTDSARMEIRNSRIKGEDYSLYTDAEESTDFFNSSIIGAIAGPSSYKCFNSNNGVDKELDSSCTEVTPPAP